MKTKVTGNQWRVSTQGSELSLNSKKTVLKTRKTGCFKISVLLTCFRGVQYFAFSRYVKDVDIFRGKGVANVRDVLVFF